MATIHVEESNAAHDFGSLIRKAEAGDTVIIENQGIPVAIMEAPAPLRRSVKECLVLLPEDSKATWS